jgi:hypothetical protein
MGIVTVGEVLDRARAFETLLAGFYASIRDQTQNDGVRLLTYYLARHRRHLDQALGSLGADDLGRLREVRLKHDPGLTPQAGFALMDTPPAEVGSTALLEAAVRHDEALVQAYKRMLEQPLGQEAAPLVQSLIGVEEKDIVMLKKMIAMDYF